MKPIANYPLNTRDAFDRETLRQFAQGQHDAALWVAPAIALLLTVYLHDRTSEWLLLAWLGAVLGISMGIYSAAFRLLSVLDDTVHRGRWKHASVALSVLHGLLWGVSPWLGDDAAAHQATLLALLTVVTLLMRSVCLYWPVLWGFVCAALLPIGVITCCKAVTGDAEPMLGAASVLGFSLLMYQGYAHSSLTRQHLQSGVLRGLLNHQLREKEADLRTAQRVIRQMTTRDPLTQAYNRKALLEFLEREMNRQDREGPPLGVLLVDVDRFKPLNDHHGHLVGDEVLKALAERIQAQLRAGDFMARYGGEEFLCVLQAQDPDGLKLAAERVRASIANGAIVQAPGDIYITASIGATLRLNHETTTQLFARANQALRRAKTGGRDQVVVQLSP